jgi:hypothetical protein
MRTSGLCIDLLNIKNENHHAMIYNALSIELIDGLARWEQFT